jgi:malate dehydrogenase (oxaloacetate-decarboxylating)
MIQKLNVSNIIACDRKGAIHSNRGDLNEAKLWFSQYTNPNNETGGLSDVISGADVFLGLSGPGLLKVDDVKKMGKDAIVFAMANPTPEIMPEEAAPHVAIMATGRSDYPNQINNVLCFPGMFRGALDCLAKGINEDMKVAAARAIADCIPKEHLQPEYIIPSALNREVVKVVSKAVIQSARKTGMARKRGRKIF